MNSSDKLKKDIEITNELVSLSEKIISIKNKMRMENLKKIEKKVKIQLKINKLPEKERMIYEKELKKL